MSLGNPSSGGCNTYVLRAQANGRQEYGLKKEESPDAQAYLWRVVYILYAPSALECLSASSNFRAHSFIATLLFKQTRSRHGR